LICHITDYCTRTPIVCRRDKNYYDHPTNIIIGARLFAPRAYFISPPRRRNTFSPPPKPLLLWPRRHIVRNTPIPIYSGALKRGRVKVCIIIINNEWLRTDVHFNTRPSPFRPNNSPRLMCVYNIYTCIYTTEITVIRQHTQTLECNRKCV
jgi:hypothetical protein